MLLIKPDAHISQTLHNVPNFLQRLESRHIIIGGKLKGITKGMIHHVSAIYYANSSPQQQAGTQDDLTDAEASRADAHSSGAIEPLDMPSTSTDATFDAPLEGLMPLPDDFLFDTAFDWFAWGDQTGH